VSDSRAKYIFLSKDNGLQIANFWQYVGQVRTTTRRTAVRGLLLQLYPQPSPFRHPSSLPDVEQRRANDGASLDLSMAVPRNASFDPR
jgi:hypothetical protein